MQRTHFFVWMTLFLCSVSVGRRVPRIPHPNADSTYSRDNPGSLTAAVRAANTNLARLQEMRNRVQDPAMAAFRAGALRQSMAALGDTVTNSNFGRPSSPSGFGHVQSAPRTGTQLNSNHATEGISDILSMDTATQGRPVETEGDSGLTVPAHAAADNLGVILASRLPGDSGPEVYSAVVKDLMLNESSYAAGLRQQAAEATPPRPTDFKLDDANVQMSVSIRLTELLEKLDNPEVQRMLRDAGFDPPTKVLEHTLKFADSTDVIQRLNALVDSLDAATKALEGKTGQAKALAEANLKEAKDSLEGWGNMVAEYSRTFENFMNNPPANIRNQNPTTQQLRAFAHAAAATHVKRWAEQKGLNEDEIKALCHCTGRKSCIVG